ncbi:MAG: cytochrome c biogenesis protein CcsA [Planctomycetota bacterium]
MATTDIQGLPRTSVSIGNRLEPVAAVKTALMALASLRLTVFLFVLSLVLVFAGTLAQIDDDIWEVIHSYFRCWFARIPLQVFFPRDWGVPGAFWFPGGWLIGAVMTANLFAAHLVRFRVATAGRKMLAGWVLIALGTAVTFLVIKSGMDDAIESELSPEFCNRLWHALRASLGACALSLGYYLALRAPVMRSGNGAWLWWLGVVSAAVLGAITLWLFLNPEAKLDPSGLRILWQLIKATGAGLVLLLGCQLVFAGRAGIVLLHGGIGLMMLGELLTGLNAEEAHMRLVEGETLNYAEDTRAIELAFVRQEGGESIETVVPGGILQAALDGQTISDAGLPVDVRVVQYLPNAVTRISQPNESSPATAGQGILRIAEPMPESTGVDVEQRVDLPAAYVEMLDRESQQSLGTYLLSPLLGGNPQEIAVDGKDYSVDLRFKRVHKDYSIKLIDFERTTYVGTETPKSFRSVVQVRDEERNVDRTVPVWMNNPLRYAGDTLYQSSWDPRNPKYTDLQVVTNQSWMIPYVACMLVAVGMLFHFGRAIVKFSQRKNTVAAIADESIPERLDWRSPAVFVPALLVAILASWVASRARVPEAGPTEANLTEFGQLPVAFEGRVQPMDTLARNVLRVVSSKPNYADTRFEEKQPAVRWLLDLASGSEATIKHNVIRIENLDVLQTLGLKPRSATRYRYSIAEVYKDEGVLNEQIRLASKASSDTPNGLSLMQKKFLELDKKLGLINLVRGAFAAPDLDIGSQEKLQQSVARLEGKIRSLDGRAPLPVPPAEAAGTWRTLLESEWGNLKARIQQGRSDPAAEEFREILAAHESGDAVEFNKALRDYQALIADRAAADAQLEREIVATEGVSDRKITDRLIPSRLEFESFFNHFDPFLLAMALYLIAFILGVAAWVGWTPVFARSANWLLWFTVALHTFALIARIYISGRPPVTNLYSSAVFIGWAAVLFALVFERVYRMGVGNVLAAAIGYPTLLIAQNLAGDGDTFKVLQAVLDTQFWLATHVVCITLGYSTTFLAAALGILYVVMHHVLDRLDKKQTEQLTRMTYGVICFSIFFSFVGTVLGGLWADDSWGRFWGWDPKENGALMIVIWNALILHARWGGMVRGRGIALLSVFGGIVTAWSWFGVNNMGVGLHSYGFKSGVVNTLWAFVASQLLVIAVGLLPQKCFGFLRAQKPQPAEA